MTEEELVYALQPFNPVECVLTRQIEGLGLGLSIVEELTRNLNVTSNTSSVKDEGTSVKLTFNCAA